MSYWVSPIVAAKNAVAAPTSVTTADAVGAISNSGDRRQTMNTPAVTMVAAWIRAETGVGPSMASGSQVCRPSCADLPIAPTKSSRQAVSSAGTSLPRKTKCIVDMSWALAKISLKPIEPVSIHTAKMPSAKPKSPTRLTMKAYIAAALADGRSYQKPISK